MATNIITYIVTTTTTCLCRISQQECQPLARPGRTCFDLFARVVNTLSSDLI